VSPMGQATSCAYWIASAETGAAHSRGPSYIQADADASEDLKSAPRPVSANPRTVYRPPSETLKLLRAKKVSAVTQETKEASAERWAKTKADWEARVTAEIEEKERLNQADQAMPGTEADRYAPDERQLALQAIKEDMEEERQRATVQTTLAGIEEERKRAKIDEVPDDACQGDQPEIAQMDTDAACEATISGEALDSISSKMVCTGDEEIANALDDNGEQPEAADHKAILDAFLASNGFDGVSNKRRRMLRPSIYPLHLAAEKGDDQLIRLLLEAGADRLLKDSSGRTAEDVAKRKNKKGSHDEALASLATL